MANVTTETKKTDALAPMQKSAQVEAWEIIQRKASAFASSTLVPEQYRGNVPNVIIAMEMAERIGASVMMVMQNLYIVHGNPGWSSKFLIATVNQSGKFSPLRFVFSGTQGTDDWGCRAVARDSKTGEECVGTLVTIRMSKEEKWGPKWKTLPELMLQYRAAAFWTRVFAPEVSLGMQTVEEVLDVRGETVPELAPKLMPGSTKDLEEQLVGTTPHDADGVVREPGEEG